MHQNDLRRNYKGFTSIGFLLAYFFLFFFFFFEFVIIWNIWVKSEDSHQDIYKTLILPKEARCSQMPNKTKGHWQTVDEHCTACVSTCSRSAPSAESGPRSWAALMGII